ncbi:MAG: hypothetical protein ABIL40_06590, partial [candidate division WOR-3 bacterium]
MTFITTLDVIPGRADEMLKAVKELKIPEGIKIREFLSLFGKPDYILIFGKFGFPALGVQGAAAATALAQVCGCF